MPEVLTYEALKAERDALEKSVEMLAKSLGYAIWGEQEALQRVNALAVENAAMNEMNCSLCAELREYESDDCQFGPMPQSVVNCFALHTPATDEALAAIQAQAKAEAIEQLAIQLEQLPDEALEFLSDVAEFETYQEEHHTFVSISNPRAVANAVLSLVKEQSTDPREAK